MLGGASSSLEPHLGMLRLRFSRRALAQDPAGEALEEEGEDGGGARVDEGEIRVELALSERDQELRRRQGARVHVGEHLAQVRLRPRRSHLAQRGAEPPLTGDAESITITTSTWLVAGNMSNTVAELTR